MAPDLLKLIIADQQEEQTASLPYFQRTSEQKLKELALNKEIIVLTGVRRCGKSVLLQQIRRQSTESDYYFNFEDERLLNFSLSDFQTLYEVFIELFGVQKTFYFDEIQNILGWESFIRRLYNAGNKIYITGSNATLFSTELGTRLTGRYISLKIYPFSFYELVWHEGSELLNKKVFSTQQIGKIKKLFNDYYEYGGIPDYVKNKQMDYLHSLYESIIYRDIIARYKITSDKAIKALVFYLASHCSKEMSYSSLRKLLGLGSVTTISDYCSYLENSFLCFFVNRYHESIKVQIQSPKKIYFIDHALARTIGFHFSEDKGRVLENIVLIELKRKNYDIYYHNESKECDFILKQGAQIVGAIQVCQQLTEEKTKTREIEGLIEAMARYSLKKGYILTESEESTEVIKKDRQSYSIIVLPLWKWLLDILH